MKPIGHRTAAAMTLIEVLLVVAVLMILVALLLPMLARPRYRNGHPPQCVNNLKQVGLAFRIWQVDHDDRFPMQVSTNEGGTMEYVGDTNETFRHFLVMSNELSTPRILFCPQETSPARVMAVTFSLGMPPQSPGLTGNSNLSYFLGVDAMDVNPSMFLVGDRNITNNAGLDHGLLLLVTNQPVGWTHELHRYQGNICLADGSATMYNNVALREALIATGFATNRLALP